MSRWEAWSFHILTLVVSVSGVAYFWMKYLLTTDDPFAVVNHPMQPVALKVHILASPFLILALGMMFNSHVVTKLRCHRTRSNRVSGLVALFSFPLMAFSGYLLQVTAGPTLSRVCLILHLVMSILFAGSYLIHQVVSVFLVIVHCRQQGNGRLPA